MTSKVISCISLASRAWRSCGESSPRCCSSRLGLVGALHGHDLEGAQRAVGPSRHPHLRRPADREETLHPMAIADVTGLQQRGHRGLSRLEREARASAFRRRECAAATKVRTERTVCDGVRGYAASGARILTGSRSVSGADLRNYFQKATGQRGELRGDGEEVLEFHDEALVFDDAALESRDGLHGASDELLVTMTRASTRATGRAGRATVCSGRTTVYAWGTTVCAGRATRRW